MERLDTLEKAHDERKFQLVLCAEVPGSMVKGAVEMLKGDIEEWKKKKSSGFAAYFATWHTIVSEVPHICDVSKRILGSRSSFNIL